MNNSTQAKMRQLYITVVDLTLEQIRIHRAKNEEVPQELLDVASELNSIRQIGGPQNVDR